MLGLLAIECWTSVGACLISFVLIETEQIEETIHADVLREAGSSFYKFCDQVER